MFTLNKPSTGDTSWYESLTTLVNQSAASIAANRIITGTGADLVLGVDETVSMYHDNGAQRWRILKNA